MKRAITIAVLFAGMVTAVPVEGRGQSREGKWVDIWGSMPQLCERGNLPPEPFTQSDFVFKDATLRQTIYVTLDAETIRLQVSNAFGGTDLPIAEVTLALPINGTAGVSGIDTKTLHNVTFSGLSSFVVPNGSVVLSDPIRMSVKAQSNLAVSMYLADGQAGTSITAHPGSRTTSYFASGNQVSTGDLPGAANAQHWYFISALEGYVPKESSALIIVGDSITDGRGSTTNHNDRWPDQLLARMKKDRATSHIAVINEAAGGNRILTDGLGPNALGRIDRDIISQSGVKYAMIFEGVNDIGTTATDEASQQDIGDRIITAYDQMITRIHRFGIPVFGATITPMTGPGQVYGDPEREKTRQRVNKWIRTSGRFDAVVDFDRAIRDPDKLDQLASVYDSGDYLHPNAVGYKKMAETVDLTLFRKFGDGVSGITK